MYFSICEARNWKKHDLNNGRGCCRYYSDPLHVEGALPVLSGVEKRKGGRRLPSGGFCVRLREKVDAFELSIGFHPINVQEPVQVIYLMTKDTSKESCR